MKKLISLVLTITLCLSLSVSAFAAGPLTDIDNVSGDGTTGNNTDTGTIIGYAENESIATVYSVNVTWGDAVFKFTTPAPHWDPETLQYTSGTSVWEQTSGNSKVKVENRSNAAVLATLTGKLQIIENIGTTNVKVTAMVPYQGNSSTAKLESAANGATTDGTTLGTATTADFSYDLEGAPTGVFGTKDAPVTIANLTMTITAG